MATILKGAPVVAAMNERNAALCEQLKAKGITPTLAVVRVGEREDDLSYERGVMTRCGKVGVAVRQFGRSAVRIIRGSAAALAGRAVGRTVRLFGRGAVRAA